jgi:hypothetical protein
MKSVTIDIESLRTVVAERAREVISTYNAAPVPKRVLFVFFLYLILLPVLLFTRQSILSWCLWMLLGYPTNKFALWLARKKFHIPADVNMRHYYRVQYPAYSKTCDWLERETVSYTLPLAEDDIERALTTATEQITSNAVALLIKS